VPGPEDTAVMGVVGWEVLGEDLAVETIERMDVIGSRVFSIKGFGFALIKENFVPAPGDEEAFVGLDNPHRMGSVRLSPDPTASGNRHKNQRKEHHSQEYLR